jgi:hypothetical protein
VSTYAVWPDGLKDETIDVEADSMPAALDEAARLSGYVDYADMAQEMGDGWDGLNIRLVAP